MESAVTLDHRSYVTDAVTLDTANKLYKFDSPCSFSSSCQMWRSFWISGLSFSSLENLAKYVDPKSSEVFSEVMVVQPLFCPKARCRIKI